MERINSETLDQEKLKAYTEICGGEPDAIYILARTLVEKGTAPVEKTGTTKRTGGYEDVDIHGGLSGGHARIVAAAELHKYFPASKVITTSWIESEGEISYAKVSAEQLERNGVEPEAIILKEKPYSTFTEITELIKAAVEEHWQRVAVVVGEVQLRRAKAMFDHVDELHDPNKEWQEPDFQQALAEFKKMTASGEVSVKFVSAEEVLINMGPRYADLVAKAKELPGWAETKSREDGGADQIARGEYWKNIPSTTILKDKPSET